MNSTIFKKVSKKKDYNTFYDLLIPSLIEMGYPLDCALGNVSRYFVLNKEDKPVGTFEVLPYKLDKRTEINGTFPFHELEVIKLNHGKVVELDGISIHRNIRREKNLESLLYSLSEHTRLNSIKYVIGIINPALYLALRNTYKIPIKKLGKRIEYSNYSLYPIMIEAEYVYKNLPLYPWLYKLYELDNNLAKKIIYSEPLKTDSKKSVNS